MGNLPLKLRIDPFSGIEAYQSLVFQINNFSKLSLDPQIRYNQL